MEKEKMDFGRAHHSGMPTAKEIEWREETIRVAFEARYFPMGRESVPQVIMPSNGTIRNFRMSAYDRKMAKAEQAWFHRMD